MDEDTMSRPLALMSVILALYAIVHVVLFAISGAPVYLCIAGAGAAVAGVTAWLRRRDS